LREHPKSSQCPLLAQSGHSTHCNEATRSLLNILALGSSVVAMFSCSIFSSHDTIDGKVEDVEAPQTAARSPFSIRLVQRIIYNEGDLPFGEATVGAKRMTAEG